jgi:RNA polymerase sigma-70 factor, ECF subfamily
MASRATGRDDETRGAEFVRLLTLYQPNLFLYIRSLVLDPDDAAEILQNTNLVMWEKRAQFQSSTNFLAWAFQIARHKLREQQAQRKRRCPCFPDALLDQLALRTQRYVSAHSDLIDELRRCLAQLTATDRELIGHRYSSKATCESIAAAMGRPVRWVYNALARIREELLECILRASSTHPRKDQ